MSWLTSNYHQKPPEVLQKLDNSADFMKEDNSRDKKGFQSSLSQFCLVFYRSIHRRDSQYRFRAAQVNANILLPRYRTLMYDNLEGQTELTYHWVL